jgi:hypothetical protein
MRDQLRQRESKCFDNDATFFVGKTRKLEIEVLALVVSRDIGFLITT